MLACVDLVQREHAAETSPSSWSPQVLVDGHGEGGLIALFATAIDTRINSATIRGAFGSRMNTWQEGMDRNLFGLLREFGDAELAAMIAPRSLTIDSSGYPEVTISGEGGGAPGRLTETQVDVTQIERAKQLTQPLNLSKPWPTVAAPISTSKSSSPSLAEAVQWHYSLDSNAQEDRLAYEIERDTQWLLAESAQTRAEFMSKIDATSLETYEKSIEAYRKQFREDVIGDFGLPLSSPNARTRRLDDNAQYTSYEVMLDVWEDVFAYGILLLPKDLKTGERRPVVVCQHGLEGRPTDTILGDHPAYHDFAAKLCERGFIVFAPQNPYIGKDRFRTLQRKAQSARQDTVQRDGAAASTDRELVEIAAWCRRPENRVLWAKLRRKISNANSPASA